MSPTPCHRRSRHRGPADEADCSLPRHRGFKIGAYSRRGDCQNSVASERRASEFRLDPEAGVVTTIDASILQPWTIEYLPPASNGRTAEPVRFTAQQPNAELGIDRALAGTYKLLSVRDKYCPGDVSETEWVVETLPRPSARLDAQAGRLVRNGSYVRPGVCMNAADSVAVLFEGKWTSLAQPRFHSTYSRTLLDIKQGKRRSRRRTRSRKGRTTARRASTLSKPFSPAPT